MQNRKIGVAEGWRTPSNHPGVTPANHFHSDHSVPPRKGSCHEGMADQAQRSEGLFPLCHQSELWSEDATARGEPRASATICSLHLQPQRTSTIAPGHQNLPTKFELHGTGDDAGHRDSALRHRPACQGSGGFEPGQRGSRPVATHRREEQVFPKPSSSVHSTPGSSFEALPFAASGKQVERRP
jgi:hypothetical protein